MTIVSTLETRYRGLMERVSDAAKRAGRPPEAIHVVAVTKYAELGDIRELMRLGHRDFGEGRAQQLVQRAAVIDEYLERSKALRHVSTPGTPAHGTRGSDTIHFGPTPNAGSQQRAEGGGSGGT